MTRRSPLSAQHLERDASLTAYPDPAAPADPAKSSDLIEAFGPLEIEYAALRKGCVLIDQPQRGTVTVQGDDRVEFLNRMLTQELKDLEPWQSRPSFWLSRKGRVDADLRVTARPDSIRFDLDIHRAAHVVETLTNYMFSEDVTLTDASETHHKLALHGPTAIMLLAAVSTHAEGPPVDSLRHGQACRVRVAEHNVLVDRCDSLGEIGLELTCTTDAAIAVFNTLADAGTGESDLAQRARLRPAGWHACNIARIESGTPLYFLDFDEQTLPHETGVIRDRVSFTKGCYLGQEVVARMEARGIAKQRLVGIRVEAKSGPDAPLPVSGARVFAEPDATPGETKPIGRVTSSTLSPMLGMAPIGFAMLRQAHAAGGTIVHVEAEGKLVPAAVQPELAFWKRG
ncbi:MAG: glycine cleavage T C-terminal barrel domain-containing protein [Planctomycetota bacterium]|nr:glycine cleavage T C-terminal barrel domain-containing protein [Planctomycetota bacterium]